MMDETLYEHIQGIARRLFPDREDHMDLVHEAVVKVMDMQHQWDGRGTFKAFASLVSANCMRDYVRDEAAARRTEEKYALVHPGAAFNT